MSTGCNCNVVEYKPGSWYYILEDYDAPKNAWDWRENAAAYGPFDDDEATLRHLSKNHANPGGYSILRYSPEFGKDKVLASLVANAKRPRMDTLGLWGL